MTIVRTRIAPSPTGVPHLGNTRTALYSYLLARKYGGQFVLRIEDTDQKRFVEGAEEKIYEIFAFLQLVPDESPQVGGPYKPYKQTERLEIYQKYANELLKSGHAYRCFCPPQPAKGIHKYDKRCLKLTKAEITKKLEDKESFVIRMNMPVKGFSTWTDLVQGEITIPFEETDDKVLVKSNGIPTYHLAVVVDDHLMKISHALRGVEWISSTPIHLKLYEAFGWEPPIIAHVPLLLGPDRSKLSKRHGAKNALEYQADGYLAEAINNFLFYLGFTYQDNSKPLSLEEMIKVFDEKKLHKQNAIFDQKKLDYFNKHWLKLLSDDNLAKRIFEFTKDKAWAKGEITESQQLLKYLPAIRERITTLKDAVEYLDQFFSKPSASQIAQSHDLDQTKFSSSLNTALEVLTPIDQDSWHKESLERILRQLVADQNLVAGEFFSSLRAALTGSRISPPIFDTLELLGKTESLQRLTTATH